MKDRWLVGLALAAVVNVGCGRGAERTTEEMMEEAMKQAGASDPHVQVSDGGVKIESGDAGARTSVQVAGDGDIGLPEGFPDDLPVPSGATVAYSMSSEGEGLSATLEVEDTPRSVYTFYVEALGREGWEIRDKVETAGQYLVSGHKEGRDVSVSILEGDAADKTLFTIVVAVES